MLDVSRLLGQKRRQRELQAALKMTIQTKIDFDQLVDIRMALNSLQFTLDRLGKLDKDNFAEILYKSDRKNLENAKKALDALIQNS